MMKLAESSMINDIPVIVGSKTILGEYSPNVSTNVTFGANGLGVTASFSALYTTLDKVGDYYDYVPTSLGRFGSNATLVLPIISGVASAYDIEQRRQFGILSATERNQEQVLNAGTTATSTGINALMLKATTQTFAVEASTPALLPILTNPATIVFAVPSIGYVIAWEQQTYNNRIEGIPHEQAWKMARDTVSELFLNLIRKPRDTHPEWYWYP